MQVHAMTKFNIKQESRGIQGRLKPFLYFCGVTP